MGRRGPSPKPWPRGSSGIYYATINGKQVSLKTRVRREAEAEFHRLMATEGRPQPVPARFTVRDLTDAYLEDCASRVDADTLRSYRRHINSFADAYGGMMASDVKILHVQNWIRKRRSAANGAEIASSTRHLAISIVKQVFEWGEYAGYLAANPIRRMRRPPMERRPAITVEDARAVMSHITPEILVALEALFVLGVRAGELCSMVAEKTDLKARKAIVTCKRTRRNRAGIRTVYLSDEAIGLLLPLLAGRRTGPIFYSTRGPLTTQALRKAVGRARRRACRELGLQPGSLDRVKPHAFRGLYATEALRRGVDAVLVARSLGQSDTKVLMDHYAAPDDAMMIDAVNRGARTPPSRPDTPEETPG